MTEPRVEWLDADSLEPGRRLIDTPVIFFTPEYRAELRALVDGVREANQARFWDAMANASFALAAAIETMLEATDG
jgi:hypothetical protein